MAELEFDAPVPLLVLPCAWFDPAWLEGAGFSAFFQETADTIQLATFYPGAFAYHWHNQWGVPEGERSPFAQLAAEIDARLQAYRCGGEMYLRTLKRERVTAPEHQNGIATYTS